LSKFLKWSPGGRDSSAKENCFSKWSTIKDYRDSRKGIFTFKLNYPQKRAKLNDASEEGPQIIFSQTSNPIVVGEEKISGFRVIEERDADFWGRMNFRGLAKSNNAYCFIDGNPGHTDWHYCVGSQLREFPGGGHYPYADNGVCTGNIKAVYDTCWAELFVLEP
jgi:hypothetical protein